MLFCHFSILAVKLVGFHLVNWQLVLLTMLVLRTGKKPWKNYETFHTCRENLKGLEVNIYLASSSPLLRWCLLPCSATSGETRSVLFTALSSVCVANSYCEIARSYKATFVSH